MNDGVEIEKRYNAFFFNLCPIYLLNQSVEKIYFLIHLYTNLSGTQTRGDVDGNHQT